MDGLSFAILDKNNAYRCLVGAHRGAEATVVNNGSSQSMFVLDDDDHALADIITPGARARVLFRGVEEFRGRISATPGAGPAGYVNTYIQDDRRKLHDWLGWQKPTAPLNAQTDEYRVYAGPTETVVKTAIAEATNRLPQPWTIRPSLGRGLPAQRVELRQHPLDDKLIPLLTAARLGLRLTYPAGITTLDVRSPNTVTGLLDPKTGHFDAYDYARRAPAATRAIIGGKGDGVARVFTQVIDTALEAEWGDVIEIFVDARNAETLAELETAGWAALAEGRPSTTVSMEITEQPGFEYHSTYEVGDLVKINVGIEATEVITQVKISDDPDNGVTVTPQVGDLALDQIARLTNQLSRLQVRTRDLGRR